MAEGISSKFKFIITRSDLDDALPYAVKIRDDVGHTDAKEWCKANLGWPRRQVGNSQGLWSCGVYLPATPPRTFRFVNEARAVEFKLLFG